MKQNIAQLTAQISVVASMAFFSAGTQAATLSLADLTWSGQGSYGLIGPTSTVPMSATGHTEFGYVTTSEGLLNSTAGGTQTISPLVLKDAGEGSRNQTNGSVVSSSVFSANKNDTLDLTFNYVSTDGRGYSDYAWARLVDSHNQTAAWLFSAESTRSSRGSVVPGGVLKAQVDNTQPDRVDALLNNGDSVSFNISSTQWLPLAESSGYCWDSANTCGPTGWINANYTFQNAGTYSVEFGVMNWGDTAFQSALAFDFNGLQRNHFSGATVLGGALAPVPEPETLPMLLSGLCAVTFFVRKRALQQQGLSISQ